jgi:hypothetical protein
MTTDSLEGPDVPRDTPRAADCRPLVELARCFVERRLVPWPEFRAALVVGSVAHGEARPTSDVDCLFVFEPLDVRIVPAEFVRRPDTDTVHDIFSVDAAFGGAHDQLQASFEELLKLLHALNGFWLPYRSRWLRSALPLPWSPPAFGDAVDRLVGDVELSRGGLRRRQEILAGLLRASGERAREAGLDGAEAGAFVRLHPDLGYAHNMDAWRAAHHALRRARAGGAPGCARDEHDLGGTR